MPRQKHVRKDQNMTETAKIIETCEQVVSEPQKKPRRRVKKFLNVEKDYERLSISLSRPLKEKLYKYAHKKETTVTHCVKIAIRHLVNGAVKL